MMRLRPWMVAVLLVPTGFAEAQVAPVDAPYRLPPEGIVRILDAAPTPMVSVSPDRRRLLILRRESLPPLSELARPYLALAGDRIDPRTNGPHRTARITGYARMDLAGGKEMPVDLPADAHLGAPLWAPDGRRFALLLRRSDGIELWVGDAETGAVRALIGPRVNAAYGSAFDWMPDSRRVAVKLVPAGRGPAPEAPPTPVGPVVQESLGGKAAPVRTFQDLLKGPHDEALFEHYMTSRLALVDVESGRIDEIGAPGLIGGVDPSPTGEFLMVARTVRPYSYLLPAGSFPEVIEVWDLTGRVVRELARIPARENVPIEGVVTGPRAHRWSPVEGTAEVFWVEALDGGDPKNKVPQRDRGFLLRAPFDGEAREIFRTEHRFTGLTWVQGGGVALLGEYDRDKRWTRTWIVDLDRAGVEPVKLWDRSVHDRYGDPGRPELTRNAAGKSVALRQGNAIFLSGAGSTPTGDRPFFDRLDLGTREAVRLWRCAEGEYETVLEALDAGGRQILTRHESQVSPPNYFVRDLGGATAAVRALTAFPDPAPQLREVRKELVTYTRADGVPLSATLYLPPGYESGTRLPLIVWAYPREFVDTSTAGQVSGSPHRFTRMEGTSHLFLLLAGYAIMDNAAMPVVGDPETMNDTFVEQIVADARACIDKAVEMGVADGERVGVGGHSYGAFMTANLLAHSDLFRAGVARSGAYNRTLTPFGFQSERRTLWEAPRSYVDLSPFMHAHRINEPLLLIHGQTDDNPGTFPLQSERLFHGVKGTGGRARLVLLPHEGHGYTARESVLHVLAEMIDWFDRHVKAAGTATPDASGG